MLDTRTLRNDIFNAINDRNTLKIMSFRKMIENEFSILNYWFDRFLCIYGDSIETGDNNKVTSLYNKKFKYFQTLSSLFSTCKYYETALGTNNV